MLVAIICRHIANIKVFCNNRTACSWKKPCLRTDAEFFYAGGHFKFSIFKALMDTCHDFPPEIFMEISGIVVRKLFVVVETGPYGAGIIRSVSHKPQIVIIICSTGFSGNRHILKLAGSTGSLLDNILHSACEQPRGAFFDNGAFRGCFLDKNFPVVIQDFRVVNRFDIISAVCDRSIGCAQFNICDTVCKTAQSHRQIGIRPDCAVLICVGLCTVSKSGKAEIIKILKTEIGCYLFQTFNGYYIDRILDCSTDCRGSSIGQSRVLHRRAIRIIVGFILKSGCKGHSFFV